MASAPSNEELLAAVQEVISANPEAGVKKLVTAVKKSRPGWKIGAKEVREAKAELDDAAKTSCPASKEQQVQTGADPAAVAVATQQAPVWSPMSDVRETREVAPPVAGWEPIGVKESMTVLSRIGGGWRARKITSPAAESAKVIAWVMGLHADHLGLQRLALGVVHIMLQSPGFDPRCLAQTGIADAMLFAFRYHPKDVAVLRTSMACICTAVVGNMWGVLTAEQRQQANQAAEAARDALWDNAFSKLDQEIWDEIGMLSQQIMIDSGSSLDPVEHSDEAALQANMQLMTTELDNKFRGQLMLSEKTYWAFLESHGVAPADVFLRKLRRLLDAENPKRSKSALNPKQKRRGKEKLISFASDYALGRGAKSGEAAYSAKNVSDSRKALAEAKGGVAESMMVPWSPQDNQELNVAVARMRFELKETLAHHGDTLEDEWCALRNDEQVHTLRAIVPHIPRSAEKPKVRNGDELLDMTPSIVNGAWTLTQLCGEGLMSSMRRFAEAPASKLMTKCVAQHKPMLWQNYAVLMGVVEWFYSSFLPYENVNVKSLMMYGPFDSGNRRTEGEMRRGALKELQQYAQAQQSRADAFDEKYGATATASAQRQPKAKAAADAQSFVPEPAPNPERQKMLEHAQAQREQELSRLINARYKIAKISAQGLTSLKKLAEAVRPHGWVGPRDTTGGHKEFTREKTREVVTVASTPSDVRAWKNMVSQFNKALRRDIECELVMENE